MKKATLIIWVIIFGFMALVVFQNKTFFLESKTAISLNLGIAAPYQTPELPNAILVLIFFFCGCIVTYLFSLSGRFKAKRSIKKLNTTIASDINELNELKGEVNKLKGIEAPVDEKADTVKLDMNATQKVDAESPADKTVKFDTTKGASNPGEDTGEKIEK
jgi:uncharacterized integral membrane protein